MVPDRLWGGLVHLNVDSLVFSHISGGGDDLVVAILQKDSGYNILKIDLQEDVIEFYSLY